MFKKIWIHLLLWSFWAGNSFARDKDQVNAKTEKYFFSPGFAANFSAGYEFGQLRNTGMGLSPRAMAALSTEALVGYRINDRLLLGVDFEFRDQTQLTALDNAAQTNLRGNAWLLGLGAQYRLNRDWAIQGAIHFMGDYYFYRSTSANETDSMQYPVSFRLKGQYFLCNYLTADLVGDYQIWNKFYIGGTGYSKPAYQWTFGAGLTYNLGFLEK